MQKAWLGHQSFLGSSPHWSRLALLFNCTRAGYGSTWLQKLGRKSPKADIGKLRPQADVWLSLDRRDDHVPMLIEQGEAVSLFGVKFCLVGVKSFRCLGERLIEGSADDDS
jgi:hypothetical protein